MVTLAANALIQNRSGVNLNTVHGTYRLLSHGEGVEFEEHPVFPTVTLDRGSLRLGDFPVRTATFTADHVTWVQRAENHYTTGRLYLHDDNLHMHGFIALGASAEQAKRYDVMGTSVPVSRCTTQITKNRYPAETSHGSVPGDDFQPGLDLFISFVDAPGDVRPEPKVWLGGEDDDHDISTFTVWKVDQKGNTVLGIDLGPDDCEHLPDGMYMNAELAFDPNKPNPTGYGTVTALCSDSDTSSSPHEQVYLWIATPADPVGDAPRADSASVGQAHYAAVSADEVSGWAANLDINELLTIVPDQDVEDQCHKDLIRNMKWAMGRDDIQRKWLGDYLGTTPPFLPPKQQPLVQSSETWYRDQFAMSFLVNNFDSYKGPNEPSTRLDPTQKQKLHDHLTKGFAKSADFNTQNHGIFVFAFAEAKHRLQDYLDDKSTNWAQAVFDALTSGVQFRITVNRVAQAAGDPKAMTPVNNHACLLSALQPSGELAKKYYNKVLHGLSMKMLLQSVHKDPELVDVWLPTALQKLLNMYANGELPELADISRHEAREVARDVIRHSSAISKQVGRILLSTSSRDWYRATYDLEAGLRATFQEKHPKWVFMARWAVPLALAGSVASLVWTLYRGDWKNMTTEQRVGFVNQCVQAAVTACDVVPSTFTAGAKALKSSAVWRRFTERLFGSEVEDVVTTSITYLNPDKLDPGELAARTVNSTLRSDQEGAMSMWSKIFTKKGFTRVLRCFGVVTALVMTGLAGYEIFKDFTQGKSLTRKTFDMIQFGFLALSTVCLILEFAMPAVTALPVAGAILAIAGIVVAIIAMFADKPPNPIDQWLKDHGIPFVNGLPAPVAGTA
ncbi:hypothetical protein ACWDYH_35630 [Nocardia goodfellowii]